MSEFERAPAANPYAATSVDVGNVSYGVAATGELSIGAIVSEAWEKTKGSKGTIWLALLFYILAMVPISFILPALLGFVGLSAGPEAGLMTVMVSSVLVQVLITLLILPVAVGLLLIGLKRSVGAPTKATEIFGHYNKTLPLFLTVVLMYIMIVIGFILLVIPGIYLAVAYTYALPLVVEKNLSPWQALETSRKAVTTHWFRVVGLSIVLVLIYMISMIPLGIGLIWTLPMMIIAGGIVYRNLFGVEQATAA